MWNVFKWDCNYNQIEYNNASCTKGTYVCIQAFIGHSLKWHLNPKSTDVPWIHLRKAADLDYKLVISEIVTRIQYEKMIYLSIIRNEISHTWSRCLPRLVNFGTTWEKLIEGWYIGNGLKSGNCVMPGQFSSNGVPDNKNDYRQ